MSKLTKAFLINKIVLSCMWPKNIVSFISNKHKRRKRKLFSAEKKMEITEPHCALTRSEFFSGKSAYV